MPTLPTVVLALTVLALLVAFAALAYLRRRLEADSATAPTRHAYRIRAPMLSNPEQALLTTLRQAFPETLVTAQTQLSRAILPAPTTHPRAALNSIDRKSLDFLLLLPDTTPAAAVELDDSSHRRPDRQRADATKNAALASAGLPLVRYSVAALPTIEQLRTDLAPLLARR